VRAQGHNNLIIIVFNLRERHTTEAEQSCVREHAGRLEDEGLRRSKVRGKQKGPFGRGYSQQETYTQASQQQLFFE